MTEIEIIHHEKELQDIKKAAQKKKYKNKNYYLYENKIYDDEMNIVIQNAENGFLDLFEYYEYFPQK